MKKKWTLDDISLRVKFKKESYKDEEGIIRDKNDEYFFIELRGPSIIIKLEDFDKYVEVIEE